MASNAETERVSCYKDNPLSSLLLPRDLFPQLLAGVCLQLSRDKKESKDHAGDDVTEEEEEKEPKTPGSAASDAVFMIVSDKVWA